MKYESNMFVQWLFLWLQLGLGLQRITRCFKVWSGDVTSVQEYRNCSFELWVPYGLRVQTATSSLVWGLVKFNFIFTIKRSVQQNLCSVGQISEDSHCIYVPLLLALEHSCGKKYLKMFTHNCTFHTLYCKIAIRPAVIDFFSGWILVIDSI